MNLQSPGEFHEIRGDLPEPKGVAQGFEPVLLTTGNNLLTYWTVVAFQRDEHQSCAGLMKVKA